MSKGPFRLEIPGFSPGCVLDHTWGYDPYAQSSDELLCDRGSIRQVPVSSEGRAWVVKGGHGEQEAARAVCVSLTAARLDQG